MSNPNVSMFEDLISSGEMGQPEQSAPAQQQQSEEQQQYVPDSQTENSNPSTSIDFEALLAERTGGKFKSVDEILQLAEKPVTQDINFANEDSKKVFEYLKEGKVEDVINVFQQQKQLQNIDKLDTDGILKLKLKYENPELSEEEINDEFQSRYGVDEPDIDEDLDDAADIEKAKKKFEREKSAMERLKKKDLKEAKDFLQEKKKEIVLPDIQTSAPQQQQAVSNEAEEAAVREFRDKYLQAIPTTIDDIVGFESKYKDSELEFNTTYIIDANEKAALKDKMENFTLQDYFMPRYIDEQGNFDTEAIAHDLYVLENFDKIVEAHISQAVNQAKSLFVKGLKNANYQESVSRRLPDEQQTSQDEMVNFFFGNT
jgi:hypothetical protein